MEISQSHSKPSHRPLPPLPRSHSVQFYDEEKFLIGKVARYLSAGLNQKAAAMAIIKSAHLEPLKQALHGLGHDVNSLVADRRLIFSDAGYTLERFMVNGTPDREKFDSAVGSLLSELNTRFGKIYAYGEMVDLLWVESNVKGTLALESLWNELAQEYEMDLLCGYSMAGFSDSAHSHCFTEICSQHTHALPTEKYENLSPENVPAIMAQLEQKARSLELEIGRRRQVEARLARKVEELARTNAELTQFAHIASHDLKEPIRNMRAYVQLIESNYSDRLDDEGRDYMRVVVQASIRMAALIDALLIYASVDNSRELKPTTVDCQAVVENLQLSLKKLISDSGAQIELEALPKVRAEKPQLVQLFQNLICNAIKFRGTSQPQVKVAGRQVGSEYIFSIKDNGIGIPEAHFDKIFLLFQRLHDKDSYPGTGLGLSICKKIVERHGGRIWLESQIGVGSTFYFSLPVDPTAIH